MKIATIALLIALASCTAAPARTPHIEARWGGELVVLKLVSTGQTWTESYEDFFSKCQGHHPNALGVKVFGTLPQSFLARKAAAKPAAAPPTPVKVKAAPQPKPAPRTRGRRSTEPELPKEQRIAASPTLLLPAPTVESTTILGEQPEKITILPDTAQDEDTSGFAGKIISLLTGLPVGEKTPTERIDIVALVKHFEGFRASKYWDHGQYSIGYGTRAKAGDGSITESEAHDRLLAELAAAKEDVEREAERWGMHLSACQTDALTSFHFNTGAVVRLMEKAAGDATTLPGYMPEWRCASGKPLPSLIARRKRETDLFASE